MVETDRVLAPIYINYEGNVDVSDLYKLVKEFLIDKKYDIDEKEHNYYSSEGKLKIKWEATQNINDYVQFNLKVTINGSNLKKVKLKNKDAFSGKFQIEIEAEINKDYQDYYEGKPIIKFFRELFDYTVKKQEFTKYNNQLKNESYALFDELKAYFNMLKF